jgi:hypothetical protein
MRGDSSDRNGSGLLSRWRGALRVVGEPPAVGSPTVARSPAPVLAPPPASAAALYALFEQEIVIAVAPPMADTLLRMLAPTRDAVLADPSEANRAASLAQLDLLEDVLDALLLAKATHGEGGPQEPEPR